MGGEQWCELVGRDITSKMENITKFQYPKFLKRAKIKKLKSLQLYSIAIALIIMWRIIHKKKKAPNPRRWWARPLLRDRQTRSQFYTLFNSVKNEDDEQFAKYMRMSVPQFNLLLNLPKDKLVKRSRRKALCPEFRLVVTIYYLAHGASMQLTAWSFCISKSVVSSIIRETCPVIWNELSPIYLKSPSLEEWKNISAEFWNRWDLPNCNGAMHGKHITIQAPKKSGSEYFNYKKTFSIVSMAVCDANYLFTLVDVGAFGSQSNGGVFKGSSFGHAMENNELGIPPEENLPGTNISFPHFVAADEAFPLKVYIMRPYPGKGLTRTQQIFNYRLSRARRIIENSFGILSSRWRVLPTYIIADVNTIERIVCATLVLHNFIKKEESHATNRYYCPNRYVDSHDREGHVIPGEWRDVPSQIDGINHVGSNNPTRKNNNLRKILADYLVSPEGQVEWQYAYVDRGVF